MVDILFFITDVKLLSHCFYSLSLRILCVCEWFHLSKTHYSMFISSTIEILNIPHQSIYFMDGFTCQHFHVDGNKRLFTLTQTSSWKMRICLSLYGILVQPIMKGLIRSMFMANLSALQETIKNKIKRQLQ